MSGKIFPRLDGMKGHKRSDPSFFKPDSDSPASSHGFSGGAGEGCPSVPMQGSEPQRTLEERFSVNLFQELPAVKTDLRILLADDHALLRRGLREFLRDFFIEDGLTPHIAETASAHNAIERIRTETWDLVILDLNLPDMPGLEILRILKSLQPTLAVLVVSIYAEEHYAARAVRAGALGYLTKETGPQELRTAVSRILQGGNYVPPTDTEPIQYSMSNRNALCANDLPAVLSDREIEVLQWIAQGRRLTDIAEHLNLSIKTVSTYRARLLIKLGMKTTAELIRYALDQQLV